MNRAFYPDCVLLAHFVLTNLLLNEGMFSEKARIINVSSRVHRKGKISFDDLQLEKNYQRIDSYAQSKLANIYLTWELQRKLEDEKKQITVRQAKNLLTVCRPFHSIRELVPFLSSYLKKFFLFTGSRKSSSIYFFQDSLTRKSTRIPLQRKFYELSHDF